jgi:hypothetical protein
MVNYMSDSTETEKLAARINAVLPNIKRGTLRFWGEWFGPPSDSWYKIVGCESHVDHVRIRFDEGEILSIWSATKFDVGPTIFRVGNANQVRWEWFYYGRPPAPENLYFIEFRRQGNGVIGSTNIDWCQMTLKPSLEFPAVEIL